MVKKSAILGSISSLLQYHLEEVWLATSICVADEQIILISPLLCVKYSQFTHAACSVIEVNYYLH